MYFIRQGLVEVFNNDHDELHKGKPILYLPKYSYFGDYQILHNLKSNIIFRTLSHTGDESKRQKEQEMDILFMCVDRDTLLELCDLFPQTAENIKKRSLERRSKFMAQRNLNSESYQRKMNQKKEENASVGGDSQMKSGEDVGAFDDKHIPFMSDEEPENFESQKEDMKMYLNKLNKKVDTLVEALKTAD